MIQMQFCQLDEEAVLALLERMPASMATSRRLSSLLADTEAPIHRIEAVLLVDPVMAAHLIRFANAAIHGSRDDISSVNEALQVLGYARTARYVAAKSFEDLMPDEFALYPETRDAFRHKSVACALAMDCLSNRGRDIGGSRYTIGLLHAFGEVLIELFYAQSGKALDRAIFGEANEKKLLAKERCYLGMDRARTAAIALKKWGFPEEVYMPVAFQYSPAKAGRYYEDAFNLSIARYVAELIVEDARGELSASKAKMNLAVGRWTLDALFQQVAGEMRMLALEM